MFRGAFGSRPPRARRTRLGGCLLWLLVLIIALIVLSLLFGGFRKGTKVGGAGAPAPWSVNVGRIPAARGYSAARQPTAIAQAGARAG